MEYLLYARYCSGAGDTVINKTKAFPSWNVPQEHLLHIKLNSECTDINLYGDEYSLGKGSGQLRSLSGQIELLNSGSVEIMGLLSPEFSV